MEFLKQNVWIIGLALGSGIGLLLPLIKRSANGSAAISATEAVVLMSRQQPLIIDVREPAEFAQGHLQGARNLPLAELTARLTEIQKFKQKPVLVYCQRGKRSAAACKQLQQAQFTSLYQLEDGLDAWLKANLPVLKPSLKGA